MPPACRIVSQACGYAYRHTLVAAVLIGGGLCGHDVGILGRQVVAIVIDGGGINGEQVTTGDGAAVVEGIGDLKLGAASGQQRTVAIDIAVLITEPQVTFSISKCPSTTLIAESSATKMDYPSGSLPTA